MTANKPRVIKSYSKLDKKLQQQIKLFYNEGFADYLIHFFDKNGLKITVLPFETETRYYMVKMSEGEAIAIIEDDDDYGDDGFLKDNVKEKYEDKYADLDHITKKIGNED